jgi:hypothetical protein
MPDSDEVSSTATSPVDWPEAAYWPELIEAYPDLLVLSGLRGP